jgi:hypothetical protein
MAPQQARDEERDVERGDEEAGGRRAAASTLAQSVAHTVRYRRAASRVCRDAAAAVAV